MGFIISRYWSKSIIRGPLGGAFLEIMAHMGRLSASFYEWRKKISDNATSNTNSILANNKQELFDIKGGQAFSI